MCEVEILSYTVLYSTVTYYSSWNGLLSLLDSLGSRVAQSPEELMLQQKMKFAFFGWPLYVTFQLLCNVFAKPRKRRATKKLIVWGLHRKHHIFWLFKWTLLSSHLWDISCLRITCFRELSGMYLPFTLMDSGSWPATVTRRAQSSSKHQRLSVVQLLWGLPYYHIPQSSEISWFNHLVEDNFYGTNRSWGLPASKMFPFVGPEHVCKGLQTLLAHQVGSKMLLLILLYTDAVTRFLCYCHESWLSVLKYWCLAWSAKSLYWAIFYGKIGTARKIGLKK